MPLPWPLAVSSLGAPELDLPAFLAHARAAGCTGVELRLGADQPVHVGLTERERRTCRDQLAESGLEVLCLASYVKLCSDGPDDEVVDELGRTLDLAAELGAAGVRVFPGGTGDGGDDDRARRRLERVVADVPAGVRILVETHDSHPRATDVVRLLEGVPDEAPVDVIWDVAHSLVAGEPAHDTVATLGRRLAHVQVKDVERLERGATPALPGQGVLPLDSVAAALRDAGYRGYLSLEWERAWFPELPDLRTALAATTAWLSHEPPA